MYQHQNEYPLNKIKTFSPPLSPILFLVVYDDSQATKRKKEKKEKKTKKNKIN
jgi:hypothetical protein